MTNESPPSAGFVVSGGSKRSIATGRGGLDDTRWRPGAVISERP